MRCVRYRGGKATQAWLRTVERGTAIYLCACNLLHREYSHIASGKRQTSGRPPSSLWPTQHVTHRNLAVWSTTISM